MEETLIERVSGLLVFLSLIFRTIVFALFAILIVLLLSLADTSNPWEQYVKWWGYQAILSSVVTFLFLQWLLKREKISYLNFIGFKKKQWLKDIGFGLVYAVIGGVGGAIGLYGSSFLIFGSMPPETMFQPIPLWAALIGLLLMPLTIAATESPLYIGYALPRLQLLIKNKAVAVLIAAFALAFQHIALPLIFDWQFMLWRVLSFIPVAILLAIIFLKTRRLFPLMFAHFLMDFQVMVSIVMVSI